MLRFIHSTLTLIYLCLQSLNIVNFAQVTEETCHILETFGYYFEQRGLVAVKGKGQLMTYYLQGKRDGSARHMDTDVSTTLAWQCEVEKSILIVFNTTVRTVRLILKCCGSPSNHSGVYTLDVATRKLPNETGWTRNVITCGKDLKKLQQFGICLLKVKLRITKKQWLTVPNRYYCYQATTNDFNSYYVLSAEK